MSIINSLYYSLLVIISFIFTIEISKAYSRKILNIRTIKEEFIYVLASTIIYIALLLGYIYFYDYNLFKIIFYINYNNSYKLIIHHQIKLVVFSLLYTLCVNLSLYYGKLYLIYKVYIIVLYFKNYKCCEHIRIIHI